MKTVPPTQLQHLRQTHLLLTCCLAALSTLVQAQSVSGPFRGPNAAMPSPSSVDGFIVKYKESPRSVGGKPSPNQSNRLRASIASIHSLHGMVLHHSASTKLGHHLLRLESGLDAIEAERRAGEIQASSPEFAHVMPNYRTRLDGAANDPFYQQQWALWDSVGGINANSAWDIYSARPTDDPLAPIIGIIDSGYRRHEDLGAVLLGLDYYSGSASPLDTGDSWQLGECPSDPQSSNPYNDWHGMRVQSVIAAGLNNSVGMTGVAPSARIYQTRVWGKCGGSIFMMISAITDAISYRAASGARVRVLNISMSGVTSNNACWPLLQDAISQASSAGIVVVASAGNDAYSANKNNPANCANVVAVAATGRSGFKTSYSNFGSTVALSAPGGDASEPNDWLQSMLVTAAERTPTGSVPADTVGNDYWVSAGTSFAAPAVSAVAAMMLSINPSLSPSDIRARLQASARPFPGACPGCGAGILDARAAISRASAPSARSSLQTIDFPAPSQRLAGEALFRPEAIATSGLPVALSTATPAVCSVSGLFVAPNSKGMCTVTATQPGDAIYLPAISVTRSFSVMAVQTISFDSIPTTSRQVGSILLSAIASSGLPVSLNSNTQSVCSVAGSVVSLLAVGTCSISASQAGGSFWMPATSVTQVFQVVASSGGGSSGHVVPTPLWANVALFALLLAAIGLRSGRNDLSSLSPNGEHKRQR